MFTAGESITAVAPAKINLFLEIVGRRPDGYHLLRSLVAPISIADELVFQKTEREIVTETSLAALPSENGAALVASEHNLATRAAQLLKAAAGYPGGVRIQIEKQIPIGGGLGGGSADAAATLRALNRLWQLDWPDEELQRLGAQLGCDVPVMLHGKPACMEGAGERITPLGAEGQPPKADWWLVVVNPAFAVPTRDIYLRLKSALTCDPQVFNTLRFALMEGDVALAGANLFNALQATVFAKYPLLEIIGKALQAEHPPGMLLSGSGASLFALARDAGQAHAIEQRIRQTMGPWLWTKVARILPDGVIGSTQPFGG